MAEILPIRHLRPINQSTFVLGEPICPIENIQGYVF